MDHAFNVQVAMDFDVESAIFLNSIAFWIIKNVANRKNYHDGRYWTYNTHEAFTEIFPYWSKKQIERLLNKLTKTDLLLKRNYNKKRYDRTCWYALSDKALAYFPLITQAIDRANIEIPKSGDPFDEIGTPIPDAIPDTDPKGSKRSNINITSKSSSVIEEIKTAYHEELPELPRVRVVDSKMHNQLKKMIKDWPKYQKDGNQFTIESFRQYLQLIKMHYSWLIKPYVTKQGATRINNLRVLTRETTITKIVNEEYNAG